MADTVSDLRLTAAEWQAVDVALRDAEQGSSLALDRGRGPIVRLIHALTGIEPPRPLADPRLEAVRRFVWASRRNLARARDFASELSAFGYSGEQIEVLRSVAA